MRVLAFGDVHGCFVQLLQVLRAAGVLDKMDHWAARDTLLIGLGDYIDRGPAVSRVLDLLIRLQYEAEEFGSQVVCLRGNHEQVMLDAANGDPAGLEFWGILGGDATLRSYGATLSQYGAAPDRVIPISHQLFLHSLPLTHLAADSLFVHGGVDLQRPLAQQDAATLMEIRHWWNTAPELVETQCGVKRIVFGHTPHRQVTAHLDGRAIAVDTGAVYGGKLSLIEVSAEGWRLAAEA